MSPVIIALLLLLSVFLAVLLFLIVVLGTALLILPEGTRRIGRSSPLPQEREAFARKPCEGYGLLREN